MSHGCAASFGLLISVNSNEANYKILGAESNKGNEKFSRQKIHFKNSPVHDAVRPGELRTLGRVLLELHFRSVRVFAPALPCLVAAQLFRSHLHAALDQRAAQRAKVVHFEAKMMNPLAADFRRRIGLENFDELTGTDLQIESKQCAVLEKIEMPLQSQRAAIKIQAPVQIF